MFWKTEHCAIKEYFESLIVLLHHDNKQLFDFEGDNLILHSVVAPDFSDEALGQIRRFSLYR